jgi:hypothetical protein
MQRRGFLFMGLAAACGLASAAVIPSAEAHVGNGMEPIVPHADMEHAAMDDGGMEEVQYRDPRYGGPRRRRPRCRIVRRRVVFRDRFGRLRERFVEREVCR